MSRYSKNHGYSTLEILIGMLLLTPLILATTKSLQFFGFSFFTLNKQSSSLRTVIKAHNHFNDIIREHDQHPFSIWPRIHRNGRIKFFDGSFNPIALRTDSLKPDSNSDAITQVSLHIKNTYIIHLNQHNGSISTFFGCPKYGSQQVSLPQNLTTYLLITPDSLLEFEAQNRPWGSSPNKCLEITGQVKSGMINTTMNSTSAKFSLLFIPVEKIFTVYIDSAGRLRYLGHRGTTNTENQPLASGPIQINLELTSWPSNEHQSLKAIYTFPKGREMSHHYHPRLKRLNPINLILN